MTRLQPVDDLVQFFEVDRGVNGTVMHFQLVLKRLQEELIVEEVRVSEDHMRLRGQVLVQIVKPVDRVA